MAYFFLVVIYWIEEMNTKAFKKMSKLSINQQFIIEIFYVLPFSFRPSWTFVVFIQPFA